MRIVIQFDSEGTGRCLYTEAVPMANIGRLSVERASAVEFNGASQEWEVVIAGDTAPSFSHPSRAKCLEWEIETLQQSLMR